MKTIQVHNLGSLEEPAGLLEGYRALDLSQGGFLICGKILADLGVDVIKIETPSDVSRNIGPFYKDLTQHQKSLFWLAYNANKRSITLDIETAYGQDIFRKLVATADFVIEAFPPGYMARLGLRYDDLSKINPRVILTSLSFFGQTGPKANYKASDITSWASGGELYLSGGLDRAPVRISFPQASLHGGAEGALATMIAHWYRETTGEGQHIDVSVQECIMWLTEGSLPNWDLAKYLLHRTGGAYITVARGVRLPLWYQCKDGYVAMYVLGGDMAMINSSKNLIVWMDEESMAPDWLAKMDWAAEYDASILTQEVVDRVTNAIQDFLMTKTKQELFDASMSRGLLVAPVYNVKDICELPQLAAREFWVELEHPEVGGAMTYCGSFVQSKGVGIRRRAPKIGEHNREIYEDELGLSPEKILVLKQARVI